MKSYECEIKSLFIITASVLEKKIYRWFSEGKIKLEQTYLINKAVNSLYF
jgi:hypothetical protein